MILDFREFMNQKAHKGSIYSKALNQETFYNKRGWCPFCLIETPKVHHNPEARYDIWPGGAFWEIESVWSCPTCGWWEHEFYRETDAPQESLKIWEVEVNSAILRKYEVGDKSVPIEVLKDYIVENPDKIFSIHDKKMEELVASVFREHHNCTVEIVGKACDGGIDLILIDSDVPTLIQVKRRTNPSAVESVSVIRELLGATLLAGSNKCIFVTTANHFSNPAKDAANEALKRSFVKTYDLIDCEKFFAIMNLYKKDDYISWTKLLVKK